MVSFKVSTDDAALIDAIVKRAWTHKAVRDYTDRLSLSMDITATHANGNPLRLAELLEADDFNFTHDVYGILRHINRDNGNLEGFFLPRFTAHVA